ncbi:hypothetical protein KAR91_14975 [Candidatus Pacearchaeota archaeon]|nr:hypothetical protein [Candidatus Pacearchaeota archaeon]
MQDWDPDDYPLPEWADRKSDGRYMIAGSQLATRDGRRMGNAFIDRITWHPHPSLGPLACIITDAGSTLRMTLSEIKDTFYPPTYIMNIHEARKKFQQ